MPEPLKTGEVTISGFAIQGLAEHLLRQDSKEVVHLALDEMAGLGRARTLPDESKNKLVATIKGNPRLVTDNIGEMPIKCVLFQAGGDEVVVPKEWAEKHTSPDAGGTFGAGHFSVCLWVKPAGKTASCIASCYTPNLVKLGYAPNGHPNSLDYADLRVDFEAHLAFLSDGPYLTVVSWDEPSGVVRGFLRNQRVGDSLVLHNLSRARKEIKRDAVAERARAALEKRQNIARARREAAEKKKAKLGELQEAHEDANAKRAEARKKARGKIAPHKKKLAEAKDRKKQKVAAAHAKAESDRQAALKKKQQRVAEAHRKADEIKAPAQRKLDEARRKRH